MITINSISKSKFFLIDKNIKISQGNLSSLSELYHENTKLYPYEVRQWLWQRKISGLEHVKRNAFLERSAQSYKMYSYFPQISLHYEDNLPRISLWETIYARRSERNYAPTPLQMQDISRILFHAYGKTGQLDTGRYTVELRAAPSTGALYPLDIYPLVCSVDDLNSGLYHYNVRDHTLEELKQGDFLQSIIPLIQSNNNSWLKKAGAIFFVTATFRRNQMKYGERGYRGVLLDAGHLSQNIQLAATGLRLGACALMGCLDDPVNNFLGVDGVEESVLYAISVGHPARQHQPSTGEEGGLL